MNEIKTLTLAALLQLSPRTRQMAAYKKSILVAAEPLENIPEARSFMSEHIRLDAYLFIFVWKGELSLYCDLNEYCLTPYSMLAVNPSNLLMLKRMEDCHLSLLAIDRIFFQSLHFEQRILLPRFTEMTTLHHYLLNLSQAQQIDSMFHILENLISQPSDAPIYHQLILSMTQSAIWLLINYQLSDIDTDNRASANDMPAPNGTLSESEQLRFKTFIRHLNIHFRQHHNVAFYAKLQHITPKYLSMLINRVSGRTTRQWIDGLIIREARYLLLHSDMSIKQISGHLCFPNESFFGKYFKRAMGMSAGAYRQKRGNIHESD